MSTNDKKSRVEEIFDGVRSYTESATRKTVEFTVSGSEVSFDKLAQLSELFQTKNINLGSETRQGGYCETCAYTYSVCKIYVADAVI